MTGHVTLRPLVEDDAPLLARATRDNVNWSGEQRVTARDVEEAPGLRHYCVLRPARGDFGLVTEQDGHAAGVVWLLFLAGDDRGYGHVADDVPELSLWVRAGHRGQGIGGALLRAALDEARRRGLGRVSLSVEAGNPAVRLYRRHGFTPAPGADEQTMVVEICTCPPQPGRPRGSVRDRDIERGQN